MISGMKEEIEEKACNDRKWVGVTQDQSIHVTR